MEHTYLPSYEKRAFLFSFLIHSALFGSYILYNYHNPIEIPSQSEMVSMSLSSFEIPKPIEVPIKPVEKVEPKPIEKIKPVEILKPIIPLKPIAKPIEKPQEIQKEEIVLPVEKQIVPTEEQKRLEKEQQRQAQQKNFVKTNFAIIREKVLSNLIYPNIARRMGWIGVVELAIIIDTNGKLVDAYIHKSSERKLLDDAALDAAKLLRHETLPIPATTSKIILPVSFKLK